MKLCEFPANLKWRLLYRATRDSFKAGAFYDKCRNIPNTLTVIKSTSGNIFGGFTEQIWDITKYEICDPNAFIFSLINKEDNPFKQMVTHKHAALKPLIYCGPSFGPDIAISDESNTEDSHSDFGYRYQHPDYVCRTERAETILAGSMHFKTIEIEVYANNMSTCTNRSSFNCFD